ncbi:MAG: permease-like cell division protein FtsX [Bacilli bacterium]
MITKFFIGVSRHIRDAFRNFFRNFGLSLSALASINVTLIVVSFAVVIGVNFNSFASKIEGDVTATAYIKQDIKPDEIAKIKSSLSSDNRVASVKYSSKEDELKLVSEEMDDIKKIADQYEGDENPLFNVFYIKAKDVTNLESLVDDMKASDNYEGIDYGANIVDKIVKLFDYGRILVIAIIAMLLLVTVFIIYNTIRITIYTRSVHVDIMKLIGASNYHITMPYIYEGILIGLFGSVLPILITVFGYNYFYKEYADNQFITTFFDLALPYPLTLIIGSGLLVIGIVVGVLGSALSIRKYVRRWG